MERAEDRLKQMFDAGKYGKKTLRKALQTAKKAGLTSAFSEVVRDVEAFLPKVIMTAYKLRKCTVYIHIHTHKLSFC